MNKCLSNLKNIQIPLADSFMEKTSSLPHSWLAVELEIKNTHVIHFCVHFD